MKFLLTLVTITLATLSLNATDYYAIPVDATELDNQKVKGTSIGNSVKIEKPNNKSSKTQELDTLTTFLDRTSSANLYLVSFDEQNQWPQTGTVLVQTQQGVVAFYDFLGARFGNNSSINIEGFLTSFALKNVSNPPDTLDAIVFENDPQMDIPSGQAIAQTRFNTSQIDTSSSQLIFTPVMFEQPGSTSGNFSILFRTIQANDIIGVYSNTHNDGNDEKSVLAGRITQNGLQISPLADLWESAGATINDEVPDYDIMMLPIIDTQTLSVENPVRLNGLTVTGLNPSVVRNGTATLNFSTENTESVIINIVDINGNILKEINLSNAQAGEHNIALELNNLSSGSYFYTIRTGKAKMAGKFIVQ